MMVFMCVIMYIQILLSESMALKGYNTLTRDSYHEIYPKTFFLPTTVI